MAKLDCCPAQEQDLRAAQHAGGGSGHGRRQHRRLVNHLCNFSPQAGGGGHGRRQHRRLVSGDDLWEVFVTIFQMNPWETLPRRESTAISALEQSTRLAYFWLPLL